MSHSTALYRSPALRTIEAANAPMALMQRAGEAAAEWAMALIADHPGPVLVLAGPGNNGGDAFVAARLLRERGFDVHLCFVGRPASLPPDAALAHKAYVAAGGHCSVEIPAQMRWTLIIDGIFGIGLTRVPEAPYLGWIEQANALRHEYSCPLLALDCPSGLDADTGWTPGAAIEATHTLSFITAKPGLFTADGPDRCDEVRVASLGIDARAHAAADGHLITTQLFQHCLKPRRLNTHKGSFGNAGIAGGASSMLGAALLAGRAALKMGAGRVYLGLVDTHSVHVDPLQPELMLRRPAGLLDAGLTALACGPGLGSSLEAVELLDTALAMDIPLVLDADALSILAQEGNLQVALASRKSPSLLTPHPLEAARLMDTDVETIQADRIGAACEIAAHFNVHVVLKGCGSVVAAPNARWWINTTGNPGMASAGTGDVLTGMIISLLAQGWPAEEALLAAVHLHGAAADLLVAQGLGPVGLTASEIIDPARQLFNRWIAGD